MPIDLLVPDLLLPPGAPAPMRALRLPTLERWLARADTALEPVTSAEAWLDRAYELPAHAGRAAIALAGEGRPHAGAWLRADPVHLAIEGDALIVHDPAVLEVRPDEAEQIVASLQALFAPDGLAFEAPAPDRWYARVPEGELPRTTPLEQALGRNAFGLLPLARGRINWRGAMTEAQMVLAAHAVNARREAQGALAINSIWFWGEGAAPASVPRRYESVRARDPHALGLGRLSGASVSPPAESVEAIERANPSQLVVLDALVAPRRRGDADAWQAAARALEAQWFGALDRAIDRFGGVRLVLPRANDTLVATLDRRARRRWWRRAHPLHAHA